MKRRHKRFVFVSFALAAVALAATLVISALRSNIAYFFSPSQVLAAEAPRDQVFRLGGLVRDGSVKRQTDGLIVEFVVTDNAADVPVRYTGILPDLFKEGKGVVAKGRLNNEGLFTAEEVLAKHDENYMPPEVQEALDMAETMGHPRKTTGSPP